MDAVKVIKKSGAPGAVPAVTAYVDEPLLPKVSAADSGKVIGVNNDGELEAVSAGGELYIVTIDYNNDNELVTDKPFVDIESAYNNGEKIVFYDMSSRNIFNILSYSSSYFRLQNIQMSPDETSIDIDITNYIVKSDGTIDVVYATGTVNATFSE